VFGAAQCSLPHGLLLHAQPLPDGRRSQVPEPEYLPIRMLRPGALPEAACRFRV